MNKEAGITLYSLGNPSESPPESFFFFFFSFLLLFTFRNLLHIMDYFGEKRKKTGKEKLERNIENKETKIQHFNIK